MASKPKKTREPQYTNAVGDLSKVQILGFKFSTQAESYAFHYTLMQNHLPYLLYDGATERVKVILSKDIDKKPYCAVAECYNGIEYKPLPYNDYE